MRSKSDLKFGSDADLRLFHGLPVAVVGARLRTEPRVQLLCRRATGPPTGRQQKKNVSAQTLRLIYTTYL